MENLLALTLAEETPERQEGEGPSFHWRWLGRGVLELTPTGNMTCRCCFRPAFTETKPRPWRLSIFCCARCFAQRSRCTAVCWWCWEIRLRWRKINGIS